MDDYEYFPVGTNRGIEREFEDYIILEVRDNGTKSLALLPGALGARKKLTVTMPDIITRFADIKILMRVPCNGFSKMLYNYDAIEPMVTHSVILCEGPFDVVGLNRKLELYDNKHIVPVATFGKKISQEQMYKLQSKGVEQIVIGYDNDAKETTSRIAMEP